MQKAERLKNLEGLDPVMGLRLSLIAHVMIENKNSLYESAPDIYPDSHNPTNAIKQPAMRFSAIIEIEKQRIAKLTEIQRLAEAQDLNARLRVELATKGKL